MTEMPPWREGCGWRAGDTRCGCSCPARLALSALAWSAVRQQLPPPVPSLPSLLLQVHRHHPPLVYGRSMADCEPEQSTGIAVCRVGSSSASGGGSPRYIAVTYEQPCTSARMVPKLAEFAKQHLEAQ